MLSAMLVMHHTHGVSANFVTSSTARYADVLTNNVDR